MVLSPNRWKYKNLLFFTEYANFHKDNKWLHNTYMTSRKTLNLIGLSVDDINSFSKDCMRKNIDISEKLYDFWELLNKKENGIFW
jgi:hypothetical protein